VAGAHVSLIGSRSSGPEHGSNDVARAPPPRLRSEGDDGTPCFRRAAEIQSEGRVAPAVRYDLWVYGHASFVAGSPWIRGATAQKRGIGMVDEARQLTLQWPHNESFAREDFLPSQSNSVALARIEAWPDWPGRQLMLLGPAGSGKSHLGSIWMQRAGARRASASQLTTMETRSFAGGRSLFIDDSDQVGEAEAAMFHAVNAIREAGGHLLIAARRAPDSWGLRTADLLSRMRLAPIVEIHPPDPELMRALLFKLFADRQLVVDPALVAYLAPRMKRSFDFAKELVEALDKEALSRGRRVTRALATQVLPVVGGDAADAEP